MSNIGDNFNAAHSHVLETAKQAVQDFQTVNKKKGTGDIRTMFTLLEAAESGMVADEVSIASMYATADKETKARQTEVLLVHVFQTHEYNDKDKCVIRSKETSKGKREYLFDTGTINALKQSMRRVLPVVGYFFQNGGTDTVKLTQKGTLSVPGSLVLPAKELEENPDKRTNKLTVPSDVTFNKVVERAKDALGVNANNGGSQAGGSQANGASMSELADTLNGMVAGRDGTQFKGQSRELLMRLLVTLDDTFGVDQANKEVGASDAKEA